MLLVVSPLVFSLIVALRLKFNLRLYFLSSARVFSLIVVLRLKFDPRLYFLLGLGVLRAGRWQLGIALAYELIISKSVTNGVGAQIFE